MRLPCLFTCAMLLAGHPMADPLKSPACGEALGRLDTARAQKSPDVERLRRDASRTCLGLAAEPPQRSNRWAQPPVSVTSPAVTVPQIPAPRSAPPHVHVERHEAITGCDANGCWTAGGTRLQRVGPQLLGPAGLCTEQAGVAVCR